MFKKVCFSPENNIVGTYDRQDILANPKLVRRFSKLAQSIKNIAPKSDDFLYFSIVFLKAAESAMLDEKGSIKKVSSGEDAWGFFDESWKWNGNVQPHRNNNKDIFPESELKKAASSWVGLPLCRDHESSSVDGIRGIILDTHYDEKFKQIIGLCALDKVNYPELARKVETGLVRYGSMGTAVETSICSECGNRATTQDEYCNHINNKTAHGEINVGLKPIEYSLVVQPAEPGAVLLKCIASLKEYSSEFMNYGVDNVSTMLGRLSLKQAEHLDGIMKTACGESGCSVEDRRGIVKGFLENNGLLKNAAGGFTDNSERDRNIAETLSAVSEATNVLGDPGVSSEVKDVISSLINKLNTTTKSDIGPAPRTEFTTGENLEGSKLPGDVSEYSGVSSKRGLLGGGQTEESVGFPTEGDPLSSPSGGHVLTELATDNTDHNVKLANNGSDIDYVDDFSINSIVEDIMNESRLRKRAELRRRVAYMQGGADGAEPNTYKGETFDFKKDKQMQQDKGMGGNSGMFPGDKETKEKLSRAKLEERRLRRLAYMQGGADGAEPNTYKTEDYKNVRDNQDKHMLQTGNMGGATGMFPGDSQTKENLHRAELARQGLKKQAYRGPGLSTRFTIRRNSNGSINHNGSLFEVFAGKKRVISATAESIFGPELRTNWNWLKSQSYGKEVCDQIRSFGLNNVANLLKSAQEMGEEGLPPLPPLPGGEGAEEAPLPGGEGDLPPLPSLDEGPDLEAEEGGDEEPEDPAEGIDNRLAEIEQLLDEVRDLVATLQDDRLADVDVNVFTGKDRGSPGEDIDTEGGDLGALSNHVLSNLKRAYRKLDDSADELSMVAETYDNISKLSSAQRGQFVKLAGSALRDADQITGETKALVRLANSMDFDDSNNAEDSVNYVEDDSGDDSGDDPGDAADDSIDAVVDSIGDADDAAVDDLVSEAMNLRRSRRNAILKQAEDRILRDRANKRASFLKQAESSAAKSRANLTSSRVAAAVPKTVKSSAPANQTAEAKAKGSVKKALNARLASKRVDEERETYRVKLRRAYDVGLEMQTKGLLSTTKTALDSQVDEIMSFDNNAFEAFKRSIGNARPVGSIKIASDLGGINIGVESDSGSQPGSNTSLLSANGLAGMWE